MAGGKLGVAVELVAVVVLALVVACSAAEDMYIQFSSSGSDVEVFSAKSSDNVVVEGFGIGKVFDYPVTSGPSASSTVLGRAQGLSYRASSQPSITAFLEEYVVLFVDGRGQYTGNSFAFKGAWVSGFTHQFPIVGGTGLLNGLRGSVVLVKENEDTYKIVVSEIAPSGFQGLLASRALNAHTWA